MSLYTSIRSALQTQALTATGFPTTQVSYEGMRFDSTNKVTWSRFKLFPAVGDAFSVSASTIHHAGVFQVDLYGDPLHGTGALETLADAVKAVFRPGTRLASGGETIIIDSAMRASAIVADPDWLHIPVSIRWRAYSSNN